jgi:Thiamine pyrophosphate-requiring enzymes [acetolactate synthase, pyruvate dehydrogenase (cytochrome), glyoxylate carboligase, phosphonopyruvate decarboxylase]
MRISDYYAKYFANMGVKYVFGVTGSGTAVQMFDSIAMCDGINYVCTLHEQAGAMAADGYARISGGIGVAIATSGPGVTNLVTGIAGAFYDSIPVIYIVGQAQTDWLKKIQD